MYGGQIATAGAVELEAGLFVKEFTPLSHALRCSLAACCSITVRAVHMAARHAVCMLLQAQSAVCMWCGHAPGHGWCTCQSTGVSPGRRPCYCLWRKCFISCFGANPVAVTCQSACCAESAVPGVPLAGCGRTLWCSMAYVCSVSISQSSLLPL